MVASDSVVVVSTARLATASPTPYCCAKMNAFCAVGSPRADHDREQLAWRQVQQQAGGVGDRGLHDELAWFAVEQPVGAEPARADHQRGAGGERGDRPGVEAGQRPGGQRDDQGRRHREVKDEPAEHRYRAIAEQPPAVRRVTGGRQQPDRPERAEYRHHDCPCRCCGRCPSRRSCR